MIRQINSNDREIYFEMSREFYRSGAALKEIDDATREKFWKKITEAVNVKGYILEYGNEVAGYALTVYYPSQEFGGDVLWIDELFVKPQFRGKGIAKDFFSFTEGVCGKVLLRLEVEPENEKALRLYESIGFKRLPYIQMIKNIKED